MKGEFFMGLFSRRKSAQPAAPKPAQKPAAALDPNEIWNTPKKTAKVKESKFADETTEALAEPVSIDPETIKKKMEALERELEEQKNAIKVEHSEVSAAEPGMKICPVCGAESDSKFCPKCGAPMD